MRRCLVPQRRFKRSTLHYKGKLALYDDLNQFCGAICMLSRFVSNISVYRIIWKPIRYVQDFRRSEWLCSVFFFLGGGGGAGRGGAGSLGDTK